MRESHGRCSSTDPSGRRAATSSSGPPLDDLALRFEDRVLVRELVELGRIDGDRRATRGRPSVAGVAVDSKCESASAMSSQLRRKLRRQRSVWKPTTSFASSPRGSRGAIASGSTRQ